MNLVSLLYEVKPFALRLLFPPVPFLLLILLGATMLKPTSKQRLWGRLTLGFGLIGIWLSSSEAVGQLLTHHLLRAPAALNAQDISSLAQRSESRGDVAVLVLGGGARQFVPEYGGASLNAISLARLRYGVWLAKQIKAPLGFSGGIGWTARNLRVSEAAIAERTASDEFGLALRWAEGRSRDTRENAAFSVQLLRADGIRQIVLVTHEQHMPRSLNAFRAIAGGDIEITVAPVGLLRDGISEVLDWAPSEDGFARVRYALYEWIGLKTGH
ncbi:YdcF family protein [Roseateles oligotrophus]|uniref:YdcF family protein n=1 Tax=Roseateles oligotrophus TaxID=1769250 RepID=A0ABT2YLQ7_9BURK|nr:YdcF family protein [Roseateles oligotrophus]MCV2370989.1 YdcF family protein [Roseateles oligotrophus]